MLKVKDWISLGKSQYRCVPNFQNNATAYIIRLKDNIIFYPEQQVSVSGGLMGVLSAYHADKIHVSVTIFLPERDRLEVFEINDLNKL